MVAFWAPRRIGWWIGVLFMFGSALFAIGGAMGTWPEMPLIRSIDQSHKGWILFVGSLFFTSAGYLQWLEVINGDVGAAGTPGSAPRRWVFYGWRMLNAECRMRHMLTRLNINNHEGVTRHDN